MAPSASYLNQILVGQEIGSAVPLEKQRITALNIHFGSLHQRANPAVSSHSTILLGHNKLLGSQQNMKHIVAVHLDA